jgi:hypothetical protein
MDFGVIAVGHAIYVSARLGRPLRSGSVRFLTGAKTVSGMNRSSDELFPGWEICDLPACVYVSA